MFNRLEDKISIYLTHLRILKSFDFARNTLEPFLIAIITDKQNGQLRMTHRVFNFPNSIVNQLIVNSDTSICLYGPENPGEFVTANLMLIESDADIRTVGQEIETFINNESGKKELVEKLITNPTIQVITSLAEGILSGIALLMKHNSDDPIMFIYDTWEQGKNPPYGTNQFKLHSNRAAEMTLSVYPTPKLAQQKWTTIV
ncbi:hypothetical protein LVQ78_05245 [Buttiauxella sp. A2-C2_NF]|uniref:hypothetical protein n=1 Tax=Buttiauxella ferragutiae TaxID=82989 RepID=UPI001E2B89D9|nr:hypothetical protein [Buttiauxella ferragutiae]MCE0825439.1 hypothetical protein [Buttiauxella ferragutiae]